jgi:hypothetical protein
VSQVQIIIDKIIAIDNKIYIFMYVKIM